MAYGSVNVPGSGGGSSSVITVEVPVQRGTLTYNGEVQAPMWDNYNPNAMTVTGETSGTNAGAYTAIFTPNPNYQWGDGSISQKFVTWSIQKADGSLSLSETSVALSLSNITKAITVTRPGDGAISASSSNTNAATVSVSGTTVTVTGVGKSSTEITVTVTVAAGANYTAPASQTISVNTSNLPDRTLANNTPAVIQAAARAGQAPNFWSVGDAVPINVNGKVGDLQINGSPYAFILGFNHNATKEGNNSIHFRIGKSAAANGVDTAFVDSKYNNTGSDAAFRMNTTNTNTGGWSGSYMRSTICPAFKSAINSTWRNIITSCTKYTDNTGGGTDTASYVTSTQDDIFLLSEFEVFGARYYANSAEQNYQKQYDYYKNGNSRANYKHNDTTTACPWWLRSPYATDATRFCDVSTSGSGSGHNAYRSQGFAPGFKVA